MRSEWFRLSLSNGWGEVRVAEVAGARRQRRVEFSRDMPPPRERDVTADEHGLASVPYPYRRIARVRGIEIDGDP